MLTDHVKNRSSAIKGFLSSIGISNINDSELMLQALVHKSYAADFVEKISDNERLEFLGDSIL